MRVDYIKLLAISYQLSAISFQSENVASELRNPGEITSRFQEGRAR
jgi:hypothetical protein